ncbi:synaptonemal complex protein 1-like [Artemia franciscana]|uniref:synaptonemal complex protein 1-like n=1 Tax=Artemia franciscana TaxID=6661 RepID=UPI0032D9B317
MQFKLTRNSDHMVGVVQESLSRSLELSPPYNSNFRLSVRDYWEVNKFHLTTLSIVQNFGQSLVSNMEGSKYSEFQSKILSESQRISEWKIKKEFELKQKDHELSVSEREINHLQQKIKEYQEHAAKLQSRLAEEKENHEELVAKIYHCKCLSTVFENELEDAKAVNRRSREEQKLYKKRVDIIEKKLKEHDMKKEKIMKDIDRQKAIHIEKVASLKQFFEKRIEEVKKEAKTHLSKVQNSHQEQLSSLKKDLNALAEAKMCLEADLSNSKGTIKMLTKEISELKLSINNLESLLTSANETENLLRLNLGDKTKALEEKERDVTTFKEEIEATKQELDKVILMEFVLRSKGNVMGDHGVKYGGKTLLDLDYADDLSILGESMRK